MNSIRSADEGSPRRRRRVSYGIKRSLRELNGQLSLLNHRVGVHAKLKDVDMGCLDLIARLGPLTPRTLARHAGLHPATVTGILDRLQSGGWITRERDPDAADRRAITVRVRRERNDELFRLYSGMNASMDEICAEYSEEELELIKDFLDRTTAVGRVAADELAGE